MSKSNSGKWYMILIGGLIGLILGLVPSAACILIFKKLYYVCLIFIPIIVCLFIRVFGGRRSWGVLIYAAVLSIIGAILAGFLLNAGDLVNMYDLPAYELPRLAGLMIGEFSTYGPAVWRDLTGDIFNIIFILAYFAVGLLFSWEFILKPHTDKKTTEKAPEHQEDDEYEYEYVFEDELRPDDIVDEK